jgi:hypothetical protein
MSFIIKGDAINLEFGFDIGLPGIEFDGLALFHKIIALVGFFALLLAHTPCH